MRFTGVAPRVSLHIPWDRVDDYAKLAAHAGDLGRAHRRDQLQRLPGRRLHARIRHQPGPRVRRKATDHLLECVDIMDATGSADLKLWFSDGTNYPGQDDIAARQDRLADGASEVYDRLGDGQRFLLEYKLFEPAFYTTDVPDWGTAVRALHRARPEGSGGGRHRPPRPGTNIEFIVAVLLRAASSAGSTSTPASTPTTT